MLLLHHLLEITAMLDAANIDYIALKGPFLSQYLYNDVTSRISNDLDILIDENDLDQVDHLLAGRGCQRCESAFFLQFRKHYFRTYKELYYVWPKSRIHVEIHTRLDSNRYHLALRPEEKNEHSVLFETCGQKIRILSDEFMLLYLCDHGSKHYWRQLFWLADIILLRRKMDVMQVEKTQQLLCRYKCHASYDLAMQLGDSLMNSKGNTRLKGFPKKVEHMVFSAWDDLNPLPQTFPKTASMSRRWDYFRYRMFFFESRKAWLWEWIRLFFLPNEDDFKSIRFSEKLSWLYFFIRPLSLVRRFVFRKKQEVRADDLHSFHS